MKIILLRHGDRFNSPLFETPLTQKGFEQADKIATDLSSLNITEIYCSPFLRTIQTIYPYCFKNKMEINIENALYECTLGSDFNESNIRHHYSEHLKNFSMFKDIINKNYISFCNINEINKKNTLSSIKSRVFEFLKKIVNRDKNVGEVFYKDQNILLVTHQYICNFIKQIFNLNVKHDNHFPMGSFEIFEIN